MALPIKGPLSAALCQSDENGKLETKRVQPIKPQDFSNFIVSYFKDVTDRHIEDKLYLLIIQCWNPSFRDALLQQFPSFASQYLAAVEHPESQVPSLLPTFHASGGFDFSMSHTGSASDKGRDTTEARYFRTSITISFQHMESKSVVIFIGNYIIPDLIETLTNHYGSNSAYRWMRLLEEPRWAIADCLYKFADWTSTLNTLRDKLCEAENLSRENRLPVAVRTRRLHQQTAKVIEVKENLRFYLAVIAHTKAKKNGHIMEDLSDRLGQMKKQLDHSITTSDMLKDQLSNLIDLEFNLATVAQSQSVAGLTVLALIYIPLSYVANVFVIPDLNVDPKMYPAAALPLLVLTLAAAWIINCWMQREEGQRIHIHCRYLKAMDITTNPTSQQSEIPRSPDVERGQSPAPSVPPLGQSSPVPGKGGFTSITTPEVSTHTLSPSSAAQGEKRKSQNSLSSKPTPILFANLNPTLSQPPTAMAPQNESSGRGVESAYYDCSLCRYTREFF